MPHPTADAVEAATTPLPTRIDEIAVAEPDAVYGEYPADINGYATGFATVTYAQLARAIDAVAHWMERELGRGRSDEALAYLGPSDIRYVFAFVAAMKAGYKLFLISPRNSVAAHVHLLGEVGCEKIVLANPTPPSFADVLEQTSLQIAHIAGIEEILNHHGPKYPFHLTYHDIARQGAFAAHTSGTTGLPKPVLYTHAFIAKAVRNILLRPPEGYYSLHEMMGRNRQALLLPLFHPAGVQFAMLNAVYNRTIVIFPSGTTPPDVGGLRAMLKHTKANWAIMAPFTLEALAKDTDALDEVAAHLDFLTFAGGSLSRPLGDAIAKKLRLASFLGSSETAGYPTIFPDTFDAERDWHYAQIDAAAGAEFERQPNDGFEMVVKRTAVTDPYQPVFEVFPEQTEYRTKDLFTRHPEWPEMWTYASRSDDVVVLLNGEKTNPVSFEGHVSQHPDVASAIVFGSQRFQAGVLVEMKSKVKMSRHQRARSIEQIWPAIEQANQDSPAHARISRDHILFADPEWPVPRTSKDSIKRHDALKLYAHQINSLYDDVETAWVLPSCIAPSEQDLNDHNQCTKIIQDAAAQISNRDDFEPDADFFALGMDSLQVLFLVRKLRLVFGVDPLQPSTVYLSPTPSSLAKAIAELSQQSQKTSAEVEAHRVAQITKTLKEFEDRIEQQAEVLAAFGRLTRADLRPLRLEHVVILTGSTGHVGSYILRSLLACPDIARIYCLNRVPGTPARERRLSNDSNASLPNSFPAERVRFLEADLAQNTLGLERTDFSELARTASLIIHNAWHVDFNQPLAAFRQQLVGVANLCTFAAAGDRRPTVMFMSSISAVHHWALSVATVPEWIISDVAAPAAAGYAESKYLAERILAHAATHFKIDARIARVGQVSGPVRSAGLWNPTEWVPRLVQSARCLRMLPETLGAWDSSVEDVDWIPIDVLADALVEIGVAPRHDDSDGGHSAVYHLANPRRTSWSALAPTVIEALRALETDGKEETTALGIVTINGDALAPSQPTNGDIPISSPAINGADSPTSNGVDLPVTNGAHPPPANIAYPPTSHPPPSNLPPPLPSSPNGTATPPLAPIRLVPAATWLAHLRASASAMPHTTTATASDDDAAAAAAIAALAANPALRLVDFYSVRFGMRACPLWDTTRAQAASRALRDAPRIGKSEMEGWVGGWAGRAGR